MTDKEIVKALKEERHLAEYVDSEYCNAVEVSLISDTLDLINRQKVEIERLTKQMEWLTGYNSTLIDANRALSGEVLIAKSEAIKEFAEKLKEKISDCHIVNDGEYCGFDCGDVHECINNILKEMVGEDNA